MTARFWAITNAAEEHLSTERVDVDLARGADTALPHSLRTGSQLLALTNDYKTEVVVRIERATLRDDALTASRAASLALFRERVRPYNVWRWVDRNVQRSAEAYYSLGICSTSLMLAQAASRALW